MSELSIHKKKRFAVSAGILLFGVAFAGAVVNMIAAPQSQNAYLHEHLSSFSAADLSAWEKSEFDLPPQDKTKIETIIRMGEGEESTSKLQEFLTGQALEAALSQGADCALGTEYCTRPIRVNRRLTAQQVNEDFRVANIKETSVRIDFKTKSDTGELKFQGAYQEARILRFYQTQGGWMQNTSEVIESAAPEMNSRIEKFKETFSHGFTGLNYYPADASWKDFWIDFPVANIKSDLETAKKLNVNSLRVFLNHDYFSAVETRDDGLAKLQTFLDLCKDKNIKVLVTLFDLRPNYTLSNWAADINHIDSVLAKLGEHEAILGIDLKNQPDLDFDNWGEGLVEGWLTVMARHIQTAFPDLAVTAGWSRAENAARLIDVFDVVTYHEYQNPEGFDARLNSVVEAAAGKPVMITELGATTWKPPFIERLGESSQSERLSAQLRQAQSAKGVFVWTLHDFETVGREIVGPLPWRRAQQKHYGLIRADGGERPAADVLRQYGRQKVLKQSQPKLKYSQFNTQ